MAETIKDMEELRSKFSTLLERIDVDLVARRLPKNPQLRFALKWGWDYKSSGFYVEIKELPEGFTDVGKISVEIKDAKTRQSRYSIWYGSHQDCWDGKHTYLGFLLVPRSFLTIGS